MTKKDDVAVVALAGAALGVGYVVTRPGAWKDRAVSWFKGFNNKPKVPDLPSLPPIPAPNEFIPPAPPAAPPPASIPAPPPAPFVFPEWARTQGRYAGELSSKPSWPEQQAVARTRLAFLESGEASPYERLYLDDVRGTAGAPPPFSASQMASLFQPSPPPAMSGPSPNASPPQATGGPSQKNWLDDLKGFDWAKAPGPYPPVPANNRLPQELGTRVLPAIVGAVNAGITGTVQTAGALQSFLYGIKNTGATEEKQRRDEAEIAAAERRLTSETKSAYRDPISVGVAKLIGWLR